MSKKVVFDIETIGVDFSLLDEAQQEYILKKAKTEEEIESAKDGLGLIPMTGEIVTIALYNPETKAARIYFQTGSDKSIEVEKEGALFKSGTEKEILEWFWKDIKKYEKYITFNGRCFDVPYIRLRSAILDVECSIPLATPRWPGTEHIDLLEELTFNGAFHKYSLDFYCRGFKIPTPKTVMHGGDVTKYYKEGKGMEIAEYCFRDVIATAELFNRWHKSFKVKGC